MSRMRYGRRRHARTPPWWSSCLEEWVPALRSADGLVSVEVADSFEEDRKYLVTELWRSKSLHGEGVPGLWFGTHAAVYEKFTSIAAFYVLWEGIVIDAQGGG